MGNMIHREYDSDGNERHEPARHYHLRCTCGYQADDEVDLDEHVRHA